MAARTISVLLASLLLCSTAGCTPRRVYITPELPLPDYPLLPLVTADEISGEADDPTRCMSRDAFGRLALREAMRRRYIEELRQIIIHHNEHIAGE